MSGPELNFLVHVAFNGPNALVDLLKVKHFSLVLSKPFERSNIIPGIGNGAVIDGHSPLRGLEHLDSEARVER